LLPDSSSTWEKDEVQFKKEKRTSMVSRFILGSRQQVRWRTLRRLSGSWISGKVSEGKSHESGLSLTLRSDEQAMKLRCHQWLGHFSQELLQKSRNLHRIFLA
jgi:hypothetical protein